MMKNKITLALCALALVASAAAPANAEGSKCEALGCIAMAPFKAAVLLPSLVVGTPIAMTRYAASNSVDSTKKIAHDSSNPALLVAAGVLGVPIGMFVGGMEGMYYGPANAFSNHDKPFSKEAFSLGDLEQ